MKDVIDYLKSLIIEASSDPFFKSLGLFVKYSFYALILYVFVYQGYVSYSNSAKAKLERSSDIALSIQGLYHEFLKKPNDEEIKKRFLEVYSNYPNTVEPYRSIISIYASLFYEKLGDKTSIERILDEQSVSKSDFWRDICPLVQRRFNVNIQCSSGGRITAALALKKSLSEKTDEPLQKALKDNPNKAEFIEENLFDSLKKVILGQN